jgi:glucosyl-3-phosphoglycerate synthase
MSEAARQVGPITSTVSRSNEAGSVSHAQFAPAVGPPTPGMDPSHSNMLQVFDEADFSEHLLRERTRSVSVCVPVLNEAATIGPIAETLTLMRDGGLLDQVVIVDGASTDESAEIAAACGAEVFDQSSLMSEYGPVKGKGDAIWRSLAVLTGDILCFFDGDLDSFSPAYVMGLAGAMLARPHLAFVKAAFSRPFRDGNGDTSGEGGRVTEEMAKPMLNLFYPELSCFRQPLSGQFAASRQLLSSLPISTGYGVDVGLLIDVHRSVGIDSMGEVHIGKLHNSHQTLMDLEPMAYQVSLAVLRRLEAEGRLSSESGQGPYILFDETTGDIRSLDLEIEDRPSFSGSGR